MLSNTRQGDLYIYKIDLPTISPTQFVLLFFGKMNSSRPISPIFSNQLCVYFLRKGHISTAGLVQFLNKVEEDDSVIVKVLKKQGAIPFVKTNVPQSMIKYS